MKKITKTTLKSFIKNNIDKLFIKCESRFSGMTDCVDYNSGARFEAATKTHHNQNNTLGIEGAWFVGQSRDYFTAFDNGEFFGYEVYNSCGSFVLAIKK